jgi:hypothetical protein
MDGRPTDAEPGDDAQDLDPTASLRNFLTHLLLIG